MNNKRPIPDFEDDKQYLYQLFKRIPRKQTLITTIKACFYDSTNNIYANLNESDRESAYFSSFTGTEEEWAIAKSGYQSKFPNNDTIPILDYDYMTGNFKKGVSQFSDLVINQLSIEILNFNYFEYILNKSIIDFKEHFNHIIDQNLNSKKHQLNSVFKEFEKLEIRLEELQNVEIEISNINYPKFYDLIESTQKDVRNFIEIKHNFINNSFKETKLYDNAGFHTSIKNLIDGDDNYNLYLKFHNYLIKNEFVKEDELKWIDSGGKSSFMRFYLKCEDYMMIKRGRKRYLRIRELSDIYKIDGVVNTDYSTQRCKAAENKNPHQFDDLDDIKSQFNLNS